MGSKRNSFHTAFQTLQDQSIWPNLVDLSKNWREMHDDKNQENLHRTLENLDSLYRGRLLRAGDAARLLDRIETLLPYPLGDRPNHYLRFANAVDVVTSAARFRKKNMKRILRKLGLRATPKGRAGQNVDMIYRIS